LLLFLYKANLPKAECTLCGEHVCPQSGAGYCTLSSNKLLVVRHAKPNLTYMTIRTSLSSRIQVNECHCIGII